ncbi:MAG: Bug family tripartite tricarboxylate transporter substrate binding protein [Burkholderiales bacterium]
MNTVIGSIGCLLASTTLMHAAGALAQDKLPDYPKRPLRIIISGSPGAGSDMVARMTAEMLTDAWGQSVVVDSRPGGGGVVASTYASRAEPDGYTLFQNGFGLLLQGAAKRVKFDVLKTFVPIVRTTQQPYILLVHPRVTANSIKEIVALSKAKTVTYAGSSGVGSTVHIGMSQLAKVSGMNIKYVAYKGSAPSILALMGGEIDMAATASLSAVGAIKTGKVRAIANLGKKRVPALADLPTLAEQGFPTVEVANKYQLWAPAGVPRPIIDVLNKVVSTGMNSPKYEKRLHAVGADVVDPISPEQLKKEIDKEYEELVVTIKELGIKF